MATRFTSSSYRLGSQVKLSTAKKIHPETGGWFLEAYSVMTNFCAKATNSIAQGTNSIAKVTNSIAKVMNSIAKGTNSIAKAMNSIAKTCSMHYTTGEKSYGITMNLPCKKWKSHEWTNESCVILRVFHGWPVTMKYPLNTFIGHERVSFHRLNYHQNSPLLIHEILPVKVPLKSWCCTSSKNQASYSSTWTNHLCKYCALQ